MKTSIKFIGTAIWVLMLTSCGQKTPTATSIPLTPTEEPKSTQSQPACCLETDQTLPKDRMGQIYVPAGEFQMGTDHGNNEPEKPLHKVYLDAFWIDRTPVTNAMFRKFVEDQNFQTDAEKKGWGYIAVSDNSVKGEGANWQSPKGPGSNLIGLDEFPVSQVSWNDAKAYCEWAGRRLPTEAEWEKAARGTDGRTYPWGEGIDCEKANYWSGDAGCVGDLTAVGSYPNGASPYGALDMAGNVWEWVADWFEADYYGASPEQNPTGPDSGIYRVLRGGSWFMIDQFVHTYTRQNLKSAFPDDSYFDYGFRCAMSHFGPTEGTSSKLQNGNFFPKSRQKR
jgi:formylglycine-generating enzyme required for sulfatase activity